MTKKKQTSNTTTLPKTLWGFYFKHAIRGNGWIILAGAILLSLFYHLLRHHL